MIATWTPDELKARTGALTLSVRPVRPADLTPLGGRGGVQPRRAGDPRHHGDRAGDVAALAPRVSPLQGLRQTFSLAWRTLVQIKHNPAELIDFSIQPVMFLLLFTCVFGVLSGARRTST